MRSAEILSPECFVTGSYDHCVRLFDTRASGAVASISFNAQVESVASLGGLLVAVAAGASVHIVDMSAGKTLRVLNNHQKTVTSVAVSDDKEWLLSGALDKKIKVYSTEAWNVKATHTYNESVLSICLSVRILWLKLEKK